MKQTDSNLSLNMATLIAIAALFALLLISAANAAPAGAGNGNGEAGFYPFEDGAEDFQRNCAACHGGDARGNGPVAPALIRPPADLTLLASHNNGDFPEDRAFSMIDGRGEVKAHGPREMPVWGYEFSRASTSLELTQEAEARIRSIIEYLKTLQRAAD